MTETEGSEQAPGHATPFRFTSAIAVAGLLTSLVLEYVHAQAYLSPAADSFCSMNETFDCISVAASSTSVFLGLPWAIWGALGFLAMLIASIMRSFWLFPLAAISAVTSIGLLAVSVFHVGAICYLCEVAHFLSFAILFFAWRGRGGLNGSFRDWSSATSILSVPAGLSVALIVFLPKYWGDFSYRAEPPYATGTTEEGHPWIGATNPEFTIEEFVDYRCPHCKIASTRTLRKLASHSDWRVVRMQQPRMRCSPAIPSTCQSTRLAYCAQEQGKFWRADRWLFADAAQNHDPDPKKLATDVGLDYDKLMSCFQKKETYERGKEEGAAARRAGMINVPAHRINGKRVKGEELAQFFR